MRIGIVQAALVLGVAGPLTPAVGQAPTQDVTALMQGDLAAQVQGSCGAELAQRCADVTPGEGRLLACLYAHGDKLSGRCELALYDAAARLERAISAITYVASECRAELETRCGEVVAGEGRVARCLKDHAGELSPRCNQALSNLGVEQYRPPEVLTGEDTWRLDVGNAAEPAIPSVSTSAGWYDEARSAGTLRGPSYRGWLTRAGLEADILRSGLNAGPAHGRKVDPVKVLTRSVPCRP